MKLLFRQECNNIYICYKKDMPVNKNAFARYITYDNLLKTSRRYSWEELSEACENSGAGYSPAKSTVLHDIMFMRRELHAPIVNRDGLYFYDGDYSLFNYIPDEEKVELLAETLIIIRELPELGISKQLESLTPNIEEFKSYVKKTVEISKNVKLWGLALLPDLYNYLKSGKKLRVKYKSFYDEETDLVVDPLLLKEYKNRWYLMCHSEEMGHYMTYAIDRIISIKKDHNDADKNLLPELLDDLRSIIGVTINYSEPIINLKFKAKFPTNKYIITKPIHDSQEVIQTDDEGSVFEILVRPNYELYQVLLSFGSSIELISPADQRLKLVEIIREMSQLYEN